MNKPTFLFIVLSLVVSLALHADPTVVTMTGTLNSGNSLNGSSLDGQTFTLKLFTDTSAPDIFVDASNSNFGVFAATEVWTFSGGDSFVGDSGAAFYLVVNDGSVGIIGGVDSSNVNAGFAGFSAALLGLIPDPNVVSAFPLTTIDDTNVAGLTRTNSSGDNFFQASITVLTAKAETEVGAGTAVPEPTSLVLLGLTGIFLFLRKCPK